MGSLFKTKMEKVLCIKDGVSYYDKQIMMYKDSIYYRHMAYRSTIYTEDFFGVTEYYIGLFENDLFMNLALFREQRINKILD